MLKVYSIVLRKEFKMSDCNTFIIVELQKDASVLKVVNTAMINRTFSNVTKYS